MQQIIAWQLDFLKRMDHVRVIYEAVEEIKEEIPSATYATVMGEQ